jgi:hypothetical protein
VPPPLLSCVSSQQAFDDQAPAVNGDKQQQLERQCHCLWCQRLQPEGADTYCHQ